MCNLGSGRCYRSKPVHERLIWVLIKMDSYTESSVPSAYLIGESVSVWWPGIRLASLIDVLSDVKVGIEDGIKARLLDFWRFSTSSPKRIGELSRGGQQVSVTIENVEGTLINSKDRLTDALLELQHKSGLELEAYQCEDIDPLRLGPHLLYYQMRWSLLNTVSEPMINPSSMLC